MSARATSLQNFCRSSVPHRRLTQGRFGGKMESLREMHRNAISSTNARDVLSAYVGRRYAAVAT
jgi:hypothetical protein